MLIFLSYFECARKHGTSQSPQWRQHWLNSTHTQDAHCRRFKIFIAMSLLKNLIIYPPYPHNKLKSLLLGIEMSSKLVLSAVVMSLVFPFFPIQGHLTTTLLSLISAYNWYPGQKKKKKKSVHGQFHGFEIKSDSFFFK